MPATLPPFSYYAPILTFQTWFACPFIVACRRGDPNGSNTVWQQQQYTILNVCILQFVSLLSCWDYSPYQRVWPSVSPTVADFYFFPCLPVCCSLLLFSLLVWTLDSSSSLPLPTSLPLAPLPQPHTRLALPAVPKEKTIPNMDMPSPRATSSPRCKTMLNFSSCIAWWDWLVSDTHTPPPHPLQRKTSHIH